MLNVHDVILSERRALILGDTGIIADLHLGIEGVLEDRGVAIPPVQINEVIEEVNALIDEFSLKEVVIAGDLKNEFSRNIPEEWKDVKRFIEEAGKKVKLRIVRGNHDNYLSAILSKYNIELVNELKIGDYAIVHGHEWSDERKLIIGHEHPSVKLRHEGVVYTFPCFLHCKNERKEVWVLPSFSKFFSGSNVLEGEFLSPIIRDFNPEEIDVYAVEDEIYMLGNLKILNEVL